jgi:hypothetical protein
MNRLMADGIVTIYTHSHNAQYCSLLLLSASMEFASQYPQKRLALSVADRHHVSCRPWMVRRHSIGHGGVFLPSPEVRLSRWVLHVAKVCATITKLATLSDVSAATLPAQDATPTSDAAGLSRKKEDMVWPYGIPEHPCSCRLQCTS